MALKNAKEKKKSKKKNYELKQHLHSIDPLNHIISYQVGVGGWERVKCGLNSVKPCRSPREIFLWSEQTSPFMALLVGSKNETGAPCYGQIFF